jgi:hypothetical protein
MRVPERARWRRPIRRMSMVAAAALIAISVTTISGATASAPAGWSVEDTPNPPGKVAVQLNGVTCWKVGECIAVGGGAFGNHPFPDPLVERRTNGTWAIEQAEVPRDATSSSFSAASCTSSSFCMAVGSASHSDRTSVPLAEEWNGKRWSILPTQPPPGEIFYAGLLDIACPNPRHCIAVGSFNPYPTGHGRGHARGFAEEWDGTSWTEETLPSRPGARQTSIQGIACTSDRACVAVGTDRRLRYRTLVERFDGEAWVIQPSADPASGGASLASVACPTVSQCVAVGSRRSPNYARTLVESWDGVSWMIQKSPNAQHGRGGNWLQHVACSSPTRCIAVGSYIGDGTILEGILALAWDGKSWSLTAPRVPHDDPISFMSGATCAVGAPCLGVGTFSTLKGPGRTLAEAYSDHEPETQRDRTPAA